MRSEPVDVEGSRRRSEGEEEEGEEEEEEGGGKRPSFEGMEALAKAIEYGVCLEGGGGKERGWEGGRGGREVGEGRELC